jgi:ABC-type branched-subunit amino acid transport system ATPase component
MRPGRGALTSTAAVGTLGAIEGLQGYGVSLLTPEIASALKVTAVTVVTARVLGLVLGSLLPLVVPTVSATRRLVVRIWICRVGAVIGAGSVALTGEVKSTGVLVAVLCLTALASAPGRGLSRSMVVAEADGAGRVTALSVLALAMVGAQLGFALVVATGALDSWHKLLETLGLVALLAAVVTSFALRPSAKYDGAEDEAQDAVKESSVEPMVSDAHAWKEISRSWRTTSSLVGIAGAVLAVGMLLMPFGAFLSIFLRRRWNLGMQGTGVVFLIIAATSLVAILLNAERADRRLVSGPGRLATESWCALAAGSFLLGLGVMSPNRILMVVGLSVGSALVATLVPTLGSLAFAVVPAHQRSELSAALASTLSVGALIGVVYATSFDDRHGPRSALLAMAVLGLLGALWWRGRTASLEPDQRRAQQTTLGRRSRTATLGRGGHTPLLACEGISFSYDQLQVLFDVEFTVDDGEVVALLGTNGAGKSTLLDVISGIQMPQLGSVLLSGKDITYTDAEQRVQWGITQIPGGRAVFGSMTVVENLQSFGYTLGRDRRLIDEAIERCLEAFPQLRERRSSLAATLSGGEQQMVGLSKALILRPSLLLIDELALGLAPVVVGPLLDMVRRINADGTAVVIVEQSVNVALSLVDHVYFMEKGSMRFDGRAADLLDRQDLLRAVFLEGAAKGALG